MDNKGAPMAPKYEIGQKVRITPAKTKKACTRGYELERYVDQMGVVTNYYCISPNRGEVFYVYAVQMEPDNKEVALHENELGTTYSVDSERYIISTILSPIRTLFRRPSRKS